MNKDLRRSIVTALVSAIAVGILLMVMVLVGRSEEELWKFIISS